jgi:hypothetical protein
MGKTEYIYQNRVVAFLDVLGFQEKLVQFEEEAIRNLNKEKEEDFENLDKGQTLRSEKADEFINTFLEAISKVNEEKFKYYLFSDNICITLNYDSDKNLLLDLLMLIADLFYSFAQKGYFLRGGIDYGKFISQDRIALGMPLVRAYKLETEVAVYPRIVISPAFKKIFEEYTLEGEVVLPVFIKSLILSSNENSYLNVFLKVFQTDDKEIYFKNVRQSIIVNLEENKNKEKIYTKYEWLAREFDKFIDIYTEELAYLDSDYEPTAEYITKIRKLKILSDGN